MLGGDTMTRQKEKLEFRYYEIPEDRYVLALLGETWVREYGDGIDYLHFHNYMEVGYCHYGTGEVVVGQDHLPFTDGMLMIVPPNLPHTTNSQESSASFWEWLYFDMGRFITENLDEDSLSAQALLKCLNKCGYLLKREDHPVMDIILQSIIRESSERRPHYKESLNGWLRLFITEMLRLTEAEEEARRRRQETAMIEGALEYVSLHYPEEIKITQLAAACSISESHFRRLFTKIMNMKPGEYINLVRIQKACEFLSKTQKSMEAISQMCGYASVSAFNRNFRRILDTSPNQWKKAAENHEGNLRNYKISAQKGWD